MKRKKKFQLLTTKHKKDTSLAKLFAQFPDLANDTSTGGSLPLHSCGMSQVNQYATSFVSSNKVVVVVMVVGAGVGSGVGESV